MSLIGLALALVEVWTKLGSALGRLLGLSLTGDDVAVPVGDEVSASVVNVDEGDKLGDEDAMASADVATLLRIGTLEGTLVGPLVGPLVADAGRAAVGPTIGANVGDVDGTNVSPLAI